MRKWNSGTRTPPPQGTAGDADRKNSMSSNNHNFFIGERINDIESYKKNIRGWNLKFPELIKVSKKRLLSYHVTDD